MSLSDRVRTAHADAWQAQGRLREPLGGGTLTVRGIRLSASGLPHVRFNGGDVFASSADVEAARAFFVRRGVPWGLRVPSDLPWSHGTRVAHLRLMGMPAGRFRPADPVPGLVVRAAGPADLDAVVATDAAAFGQDPDVERAWLAPQLGAAEVLVALAEREGAPVGTAFTIRTDGLAG